MAATKDPVAALRGATAPPCTMVIFGSSGDLTRRLLMPALYNLAKAGRLSEHFSLIGVDRAEQSTDAFRDYLAEGVKTFVSDTAMGGKTEPFDKKAWDFVAKRLLHLSGDLTDGKTYKELKRLIDKADKEDGTDGNALFYLAVGSRLFGTIVDQLGAAGLATEKKGTWRRVIIEKPFGHDFESGRALNAQILKTLNESQIYRMDHFLGKETVQNIMALRFANGIFEPLWNRDHIDHVQISVAETVGVEHRAAFYEVTGALRDMVPNHVFQLLSLTAMEPPNSFAADAVRTEKQKVLDAVMHFDEDDVRRNVVRGQYGAGVVRNVPRKAYVQEDGVDPQSATETYVAMRLGIDNWRWAGVPFYLRTGKSMTRRTTEIAIQFKNVPFALFRDTGVDNLSPNVLALQIQPDEGASLQFSAKQPGPEIQLGAVRMDFRYSDYFRTVPATGYETLVYDCMIGDAMLFQRADSVEAGWAIVQPILDLWQGARDVPLALYAAGAPGPDAAEELLWRSGRQWRPID
ncbi:MAG TPA: glucose-6-phosphate dehydrogenase [Stellaceae bacterium]|jgi:glucose-6-phosphate 1-dehydrogenase|nr:glucose-6-phosphate dehydrogenase [Stellaceae bacterium]